MGSADTIAAVATPPGRGGVGVIRISGSSVPSIAVAVLGSLPSARRAELRAFHDSAGNNIDQGIALYFPAPNSFTGEDVLELQGHGGPVVMDMLLQRACELGARVARPGEFSERAFLNGKLDLAQAEAVADLIESGSQASARAALRSLEGAFSRRVHEMVEALIHLRTQIEAAIDFPEEEIDFLADTALQDECRSLKESIDRLLADTRQGCLLHDGMTIVLAGRPNAGKSSLMNALAQRDTAIVSPVPGTTRDTLREHIQIDGMPLHLIDTAGLRDTGDEIESEGVRRAQQAMQRADRVLLLLDDSDATTETFDAVKLELPPGVPCTVVRNKIDKSGRAPGVAVPPDKNGSATEIALSALTGAGLPALREHLKACMGFQSAGSGTFSARRRHLDAMQRARRHVVDGLSRLEQKQGDLAAEELRLAQQALGEITGEFAADDLLGRIFSSFCIGK